MRFPCGSLIFRIRHGFRREDSWNLDTATAKFLYPRLGYLADILHGHPMDIEDEVWFAMLYKMADGFERMADSELDVTWNPAEIAYAEECLDLFREFYFNLWD